MCGIVGYIGNKNGVEAIVDGLKRLEYRGYDSWGIATKADGKIKIHKQVGKIGGFNFKKELPDFAGTTCIGHTRWATHGGVTKENSHPHTSCDGRIVVVHNGIVENYQQLKEQMLQKGHKFKSQTDTEVIAHLIEQELKKTKDLTTAVRGALKKIEGSYALGILDQKTDTLIGARLASPLILGVGLSAPRPTTYVIKCDNASFYIGQTKNLPKRWKDHKKGLVDWTKRHKPLEIIHYEEFDNIEGAIKREKDLKTGFGRKWLKREYKSGRLNGWNESASRQASKNEFYLGSDVPAFLKYTNQVVFLDEGEMAVIEKDKKGNASYKLLAVVSGKSIKPKLTKIAWDIEAAEKGGHPHFMIKEMLEQPEVIRKTAGTDRDELGKAAKLVKSAKRVFVVACGTALHAGMYGAYLLAKRNNIMVQPISAGELSYFSHLFKKGDLIITVSQSGETADVLEAVRSAHKAGAKVLALVNVLGSSLMRLADRSILTKAGSEICVLSTKAYISQQAMFAMLSGTLDGKVAQSKKDLQKVAANIAKILEKKSLEKIKATAKKLAKVSNLYALGRSINYANSLESCLKIKEVSYIHAEGFAGGDLKHGPISLIEKDVPVLVFVSPDSTEAEIISNAMEVKARGAHVIGISPHSNPVFDEYFPVADLGDLTPITAIVYAQLMAYYIALEKKLDPDKPRNLAKSVTVK